ncbi:Trp operon repressor [Vibrio navarrensis]|jgi:TrpR family trp operon transcriptional repressor|uniref:Trp operon repressor homolog n=2 Tax=Vibrio TaxID=662 RepID=A0A099LYA3_9VIBR|nr:MULTISPECIES: trp operon repressor [Vibrio]EGR2796532.1 trp operon repressor [Vibrio navarrensis]EHA1125767.1 trp operon repressor [Vibrio navarrensis]EJK2116037.1 trp operon repressor [Vibrio navarrensis]EJL6395425.1 trp operon repressor [Vibrio navarrensis]EJL6399735.1 trp operon repressor [Vibrio navarrensis]
MSQQPEYSDWQQIIELVKHSVEQGQHEMLLTMLMTPDEREALLSRVNIVRELLKGELSQRQISQLLGVGVATITRGSNELKARSDEEKAVLMTLLEANKKGG